MVDGAEPGRGTQHDRQLPARDEVDLQKSARQWHHEAAGRLHHERSLGRGRREAIHLDLDTVALGRQMGRGRRVETVGLGYNSVGAKAREARDGLCIRFIGQTALHRLPVVAVERGDEG